MMKVVVAMDSFKGSLSSLEAGEAVKDGILKAVNADVCVRPLADGGEGTAKALTEGLSGCFESANVTGPLGNPVKAEYGIIERNGERIAVMEMAAASGITLVDELNPHKASSRGTGEMIKDAFNKGIRRFLIGIGGSATTEGGLGMLKSLGFSFLDKDGCELTDCFDSLSKIQKIDDSKVPAELLDCHFDIMCDVENPLCGESGAVKVFGPQKGVKDEEKDYMDECMKHYAVVCAEYSGKDVKDAKGAGAAGGMGFAFLNFFPNARLLPGVQAVLEITGLESDIKDTDIVVTGEGRLDATTAMGKAPSGLAKYAKSQGCKTLALGGSVLESASLCNEAGIDAFFSIIQRPCTLEEAMDKENARKNLMMTAEQIFRWL